MEEQQSWEPKLELVIFDLDGVIVSTDQYHYKAWDALAKAHNLNFSYEINHRFRGVGRADCLKILLEINGQTASSEKFAAMLEEKNSIYRESLRNLAPEAILPGALALLEDLKAHDVPVAIGSSSKNTPLILRGIGLYDAFDAIVDGNCISNSKPHPEVFLKGAQQLNKNPAGCVVYEDAAAGIEAALAADMIAIGVGEKNLPGAHRMAQGLENESYAVLVRTVIDVNNGQK